MDFTNLRLSFDRLLWTGYMILSIGLNNAYQKVLIFDTFSEGKVLRAKASCVSASGKGLNTARALKTLGSNPVATGFVGGTNGGLILEELKREAVHSDFVWTETNTRLCLTVVNRKNNSFTELIEPSGKIRPSENVLLKKKLSKLFKRSKLATISGTMPPGVPENMYRWMIKEAAKSGTRVLADISKEPMFKAVPAKPYLIKMNRDEFVDTFRNHNIEDQIYKLFKKGISWVVITDGKKKFLAGVSGKLFLVTPPKIKAVNGVGSGDAMLAGLAYGIDNGLEPQETLKLASAAGAASALTIRPGEFSVTELRKLVKKVRVRLL